MRPFQQADPSVQLMLVDRDGLGTRDRVRAGTRRGARRSAMSDALAALAFTKLFPFVPIASTSIKRSHGRAGSTLAS